MVFFFGSGLIGLILFIPMLILFLNPKWVAKKRAQGTDVMLIAMWSIFALDVLVGSIIFVAIQGGLLIWYYHQRKQAAQNEPQLCTNCHKPFDLHAVTGSGIYCPTTGHVTAPQPPSPAPPVDSSADTYRPDNTGAGGN